MLLRCRIPLAHFELDIDVAFDARRGVDLWTFGFGKNHPPRRHRRLAGHQRREKSKSMAARFSLPLAALIDRRENAASATSHKRVRFSHIFRCGKISFSAPAAAQTSAGQTASVWNMC